MLVKFKKKKKKRERERERDKPKARFLSFVGLTPFEEITDCGQEGRRQSTDQIKRFPLSQSVTITKPPPIPKTQKKKKKKKVSHTLLFLTEFVQR